MISIDLILFTAFIVLVTAFIFHKLGQEEAFQKGYHEGFVDSTNLFANQLGMHVEIAEKDSDNI